MVSSINGGVNRTFAEFSRPTEAEMKQHRQEMFTQMDTNGDGTVDKAEFSAFGKQMAEATGRPDQSDEIFSAIDTDGDGVITQAEADAFEPPAPPTGDMPAGPAAIQSLSSESLATLLESLQKDDSSESWTLQNAIQQYLDANCAGSQSTLNLLG